MRCRPASTQVQLHMDARRVGSRDGPRATRMTGAARRGELATSHRLATGVIGQRCHGAESQYCMDSGAGMPPPSNPLTAYVPGTKAWFPDAAQGWVSATLMQEPTVGADGGVTLPFVLDESGDERVVRTTIARLEEPGGSEAALRDRGLSGSSTVAK